MVLPQTLILVFAFRTNIPSVFAIGDVIEGPMLAHKARPFRFCYLCIFGDGGLLLLLHFNIAAPVKTLGTIKSSCIG